MDVVAATCDLAIVVSPDHNVMSVISSPNTGLGARAANWTGSKVEDIFAGESWAKLRDRLTELPLEPGAVVALELNHADTVTFPYPVRYSLTMLDQDGTFIMAGRDLRALAEVQQQLVQAQLALERDYEAQREIETRYRVVLEVNDSPVLIVSMSTGKIVDLNAAAAQMIGAPRAELLQAPVGQEFEGRRRGEFMEQLSKSRAPKAPAGRTDRAAVAPAHPCAADAVPRLGRPAVAVPHRPDRTRQGAKR